MVSRFICDLDVLRLDKGNIHHTRTEVLSSPCLYTDQKLFPGYLLLFLRHHDPQTLRSLRVCRWKFSFLNHHPALLLNIRVRAVDIPLHHLGCLDRHMDGGRLLLLLLIMMCLIYWRHPRRSAPVGPAAVPPSAPAFAAAATPAGMGRGERQEASG